MPAKWAADGLWYIQKNSQRLSQAQGQIVAAAAVMQVVHTRLAAVFIELVHNQETCNLAVGCIGTL